MRQGQNPAKMGLKAYQSKRLGVALLSYIPNQEGFFKNSLEILKYQIASIHAATSDFDLLVFDNGSCSEVREELLRLHTSGLIHTLFLSQFNIGKVGAINWLLSAMPNDWICYSDGDIFFRPGWLENSLAIFDAFSSAGLVFAQPTLFDTLRGTGQAYNQLKADARYRLHLGFRRERGTGKRVDGDICVCGRRKSQRRVRRGRRRAQPVSRSA
jgi:glycosyltransferase involved in cell wall biosynthesis